MTIGHENSTIKSCNVCMHRRFYIAPALLAGFCVFPPPMFAQNQQLPTNPSLIAGDVSITTKTTTMMQVDQSSSTGIINWEGFSIGEGSTVSFKNGDGATLNRVTGNDLSQINGSLNATGSVYLINENGVVFGERGLVSTGGDFVASTLNVADSDFLNGGNTDFVGEGTGFVLNLGEISSLGGDVALISRNVTNRGVIVADKGTVGLIAGRDILMRDKSLDEGKFLVRIGGADTEVEEAGMIRAAAAELRANGGNIYALAGNTNGSIQATGFTKVEGRIFLTGGKGSSIDVKKKLRAQNGRNGGKITVNGGNIDASSSFDSTGLDKGGSVQLYANVETRFSGEILSFGDREAGNGGFAEVSGRKQLTFAGTVDTGGGVLLIDPENVQIIDTTAESVVDYIQGASTIDTGGLITALATGDVVVHTTSDPDSSVEEAGSIAIGDPLIFDSTFDLSLLAHGDIIAFASVQNGEEFGGGDVNLVAGWDGVSGSSSFVSGDWGVADFDVQVFENDFFRNGEIAPATTFGNLSENAPIYGLLDGATAFSDPIFEPILPKGNIFFDTELNSVSFGSRSGSSQLFANDIYLRRRPAIHPINGVQTVTYRPSSPSAMVGFKGSEELQGSSISGDISLRAKGLVSVNGNGSDAQIGHIGRINGQSDSLLSIDASGKIDVASVGDVLSVAGGASYSMFGHGSPDIGDGFQIEGSRGGKISLISSSGRLYQEEVLSGIGGGTNVIGHHSGSNGNAILNADVLIDVDNIEYLEFDPAAEPTSAEFFDTLNSDVTNHLLENGNLDINLRSEGFIFLDPVIWDSEFSFRLSVSGDISISEGASIANSSAGNIILATSNGDFSSGGESAVSTAEGRWLIYSKRPDSNMGDVDIQGRDFLQYGFDFDPSNVLPATLPSGNGLVYSSTPTLTFFPEPDAITYGNEFGTEGATVSFTVTDGDLDDVLASPRDFLIDLADYETSIVTADTVSLSSSGNPSVGTFVDGLVADTTANATAIPGVQFVDATGDLTVFARSLEATVTGSTNKVYDGTQNTQLTLGDNRIAGDIFSVNVDAAYEDSNVGTNINIVGGAFELSGEDSGNYTISSESFSATGNITPREITLGSEEEITKIYDGTTLASISLIDDRIDGDDLVVTGAATYGSKNVGSQKSVNVTLDPVTGSDARNYILNQSTLELQGEITPRPLRLSAAENVDKIYDGTTFATVDISDDRVAGDDLIVFSEARFVDKNVGIDKLIEISVSELGGADARNYSFNSETVGSSGTINALALEVNAIGEIRKTYDGLTGIDLNLEDNRIANDNLIFDSTANFDDKNAGENKTITVIHGPLTGSDAENYTLVTPMTLRGAISKRELIVGDPISPEKIYDEGTAVEVMFESDNALEGDSISVSAIGRFEDPDIGENKPVELSAGSFVIVGPDSGNYDLVGDLEFTGLSGAVVQPSTEPEPEPGTTSSDPGVRSLQEPEIDTVASTPKSQPLPATKGFQIFSDASTNELVRDLQAASVFCRQIGREEYVIDCLGDRLAEVARRLPENGAYADSREALAAAARKLEELVRENASVSLPLLTQGSRSIAGGTLERPLRAVTPNALSSLIDEAVAIIDEAQTTLLRSAENSTRRKVHLSRISAAIGSNKLLLRSI